MHRRTYTFIGFAIFLIALLSVLSVPSSTVADATMRGQFSNANLRDDTLFKYAEYLLEEGEYEDAAREFDRLVVDFPNSSLRPRAQYMAADAYFDAAMYNESQRGFAFFLANFPRSPYAEKANVLMSAAIELERTAKPALVPTYSPSESIFAAEKPLKAVQVMFFGGRSYAEIESEFATLEQNGIDTVIMRVFHNRGDRLYPLVKANIAPGERGGEVGVYFNTDKSPVVEDILGDVVKIAHRHDIKLFAWMTTRYANYGIEDRRDLQCKGYNFDTGKIERCKGLDLFNEEAVRRLENIYADLASYEIDGILFQDDLVLRHNEGYGEAAERGFRQEMGRPLSPELFYNRKPGSSRVDYTARFWEWASWKNRKLLGVADRLMRTVKRKNPDVRFAINLMYEAVTSPVNGLAWLSQDLERVKGVGFDYYSIMAYHRQMGDELHKNPEEIRQMIVSLVKEAVRVIGEPHKVLIKFQTVDWNTSRRLPNSEVVSLVHSVRSTDTVSLAVIPYRRGFPFYELGGATEMAKR